MKTTEKSAATLLEEIKRITRARNYFALAVDLMISPSVLSRTRKGRLPMTALLLVRMHEVTGISIKELRAMMGDYSDRLVKIPTKRMSHK